MIDAAGSSQNIGRKIQFRDINGMMRISAGLVDQKVLTRFIKEFDLGDVWEKIDHA